MTATDTDLVATTVDTLTPVRRVVDVDGIPMSALVAQVPRPRAVVVALHGGATNSAYFDCPGHPRYSLLRVAAALGYTAIALDRPGYGSSHPHAVEVAPAERRVDLAYGAIDRLLDGSDRGEGLFVLAHSVGCELGTRLAADERGHDLLGLELSGTGRRHQDRAHGILGSSERNAPPAGVRELLWTPERLYPRELLGGGPIASATPSYETRVVGDWPGTTFPDLAARVTVPVHFTAGEYEHVWRNDPEALQAVAALFTAAQRFECTTQPDGGHNLSLGHTAAAYHLSVLSFLEECIAGRRHGTDSEGGA
ncbi:alpha/beta fold hydrolase [Rhodococcus triatomae]|nr:hypothetical protein G419_20515 [Rhodococcus triatomae BKS 15-14]